MPRRNSFLLRIEQFGPLALAMGFVALSLLFSDDFAGRFDRGGWSTSDLYSAVFNWAAIQTGFVFGVYGFVLAKRDGFVEEIRETTAFKRSLAYIRRANIGCFSLAVTSLPLVIADPSVSAPLSLNYLIVCLWFSLFIWSFLSFLRVSFTFGQMAGVKDHKPFYGA